MALVHQPSVTKVYAIPGSAAMSDCAELVGIDWQQSNHLIRFLKDNHVDLVVVGPEAPLVAGLADALNVAGILCLVHLKRLLN